MTNSNAIITKLTSLFIGLVVFAAVATPMLQTAAQIVG